MNRPLYERAHRIRFSECDPAGIVFYPQYFILFNDLVESWVDDSLLDGYHQLIGRRRIGMPTVRLEAEFKTVSRLGDDVLLALSVERVGRRSLQLGLSCVGPGGEQRMAARQTIVTTSLDTHNAIEIPDDLRAAAQRGLSTAAT